MAACLTPAAMSSVEAQRALLFAHPDAAGEWVWSIAVEAQLTPRTTLVCRYSLYGDIAHVCVPGARAGRRADDLWKHTCFEAFVAADNIPGYFEFNFSPSLDWAAYRFADYRAGMSFAPVAQAPGLQVRRTSSQLELTATVHLVGLTPLCEAPVLRLALAAVIEEDDGRLSYWALQHPPGNPDFHHPDGFALELRNS
jgi:hypothetical protein